MSDRIEKLEAQLAIAHKEERKKQQRKFIAEGKGFICSRCYEFSRIWSGDRPPRDTICNSCNIIAATDKAEADWRTKYIGATIIDGDGILTITLRLTDGSKVVMTPDYDPYGDGEPAEFEFKLQVETSEGES